MAFLGSVFDQFLCQQDKAEELGPFRHDDMKFG
jgi:hypothetical protein